CVDCFTTGTAVSVPDIAATGQKWPAFRQAALSQRFLSVHATPMRLRGTVIGTMNLFGTATGEVNRADAAVAQALADVATIGIIQERVAAHSQLVAEQLQRALDSRILIEQAKGALAQATTMTTDEAFNSLRRYARSHNLTLHAVAEGVTGRTIAIDAISEASSSTRISR
ncbi:MAG: ANTAR domain-containing protein, partial [Tepidiformaceae bacterium]